MISVQAIESVLPQTQCGECGYAGCRPYAEALAQGLAPIDRCPPGGIETLRVLARLLAVNPEPYLQSMEAKTRLPAKAVIRESECIGCTKCIQACPVDAVIGSAKHMHSILSHECTGCGLCIEPCPVDCIDLLEQSEATYDPEKARARYHARTVRLLRETHEKQQLYRQKRQLAANQINKQDDKQAKQDYIRQALARTQAKKNHESTKKTGDF